MRKISIEGVWADFQNQIETQSTFYEKCWVTFPHIEERSIATENYLLNIGVMFEGFINDLILALANRDCTQVANHLEASISSQLGYETKAGQAYRKYGGLTMSKHLKRSEISELMNPNNKNTSFSDYGGILKFANAWCAQAHRVPFNQIGATDRAVIDLLIAVRNNLAHRSPSSLGRVNELLVQGALYPTGLQRGANKIKNAGTYFRAMHDDFTRADRLAELVYDASERLIPT